MDRGLVQTLGQLRWQGEQIALITVVATQGSTPRKSGAAMLLTADGRIWGSIGGGCGEADARQAALLALSEGRSRLYTIRLLNAVAANEGMVCGGIMEVFIQLIKPV